MVLASGVISAFVRLGQPLTEFPFNFFFHAVVFTPNLVP